MKRKIEKQNLNKPQHHWLLILRVMWRYSFRSKWYPSYLYNIYGSEGHLSDRHYVDSLIQQHGFWKAVRLICYNAT